MKLILTIILLIINLLSFGTTNLNNNFVIVIPSYNNSLWYKKNLDNVVNQTYKNYRVIYIDDCSTDNTATLVEEYIKNIKDKNLEDKFQLIKNKERKFALHNIYHAIHACQPNEIIVCLDGDDWFYNNNVLAYLNKVYQDENVWLTYGQYIHHPDGSIGGARELPKYVIEQNLYRKYDWVTTHLRTFYAYLFHAIKKEDLMHEGNFFTMAGDVALMYPLIEMAGQHSKFIPEILYVYNLETTLNDNKVNKELQCHLYNVIRSKKPYAPYITQEKKFVIIIPSYNNAKYYAQNLYSVFNQRYNNYRVIYIDDCSKDDTANLVENYIKDKKLEKKITLIKNTKRQLALANIYKTAISCDDDEIIVLLDGDDKLANKFVLKTLNETYNNFNVWLTHGSFVYQSSGLTCGYDPSAPEHIVKGNMFREFPHCLIHLRTFYAWLFKQIKVEDLFFRNNFFKMTYDVAIFLPMVEMAAERQKFINEILYIYNNNNDLNDHKINVGLQHYLNKYIRQKNKYKRLENSNQNFLSKFDNSKADIITISFQLYENLKSKFENIILFNNQNSDKNIIKNLFDNNHEYIMFLGDNFNIKNTLNINSLIKDLELTKVFGMYISCSNITNLKNNYTEIMNNNYVFRYSNSETNYLLNLIDAALYRKKDIKEYFDMQSNWKQFGLEKICLLKLNPNV